MDNQTVYLSAQEWQQVLAMISLGPWRDANPLLMKIGAQLQAQSARQAPPPPPGGSGIRIDGNGREIRDE
jgi:hypothetical protein